MTLVRPQEPFEVVPLNRVKGGFMERVHRTGPGQLLPLVLAAEPPPERLLHFETSQIANSR